MSKYEWRCDYWSPAVNWICWSCGRPNNVIWEDRCRQCGYLRNMGGCLIQRRWNVDLEERLARVGMKIPKKWWWMMRNAGIVMD